jgi:hypothetical protein
MPLMSGRDLAKEIRKLQLLRELSPSLYVVLVSGEHLNPKQNLV